MLSLFRSEGPFSYVLLFFYCLAIKFLLYLFPDGADKAASVEMPYLFSFLENNTLLNFVFGFICLFLQAIWVNSIFAKGKLIEGKMVGPGMVFCTVSSIYAGFNYLSLPMLTNFGIIFLADQLMSIQNRDYALARHLNLGLATGVLIILHPAFLLFTPFILICLMAIKPIMFRDLLIFFIGLITPLYFTVGLTYLMYGKLDFSLHDYLRQLKPIQLNWQSKKLIIITTFNIVLLFYGFIQNRNLMRFTTVRIKKTFDWFFIFSIGVILATAFAFPGNISDLVYLTLPLAFYLSLFFFRLKKNMLAELIHFLFLTTIIIFQIIHI